MATRAVVGVVVVLATTGCGADPAPAPAPTSSPATSAAVVPGVATGTPVDWLTAVCPDGAYQGMEVSPDGRGGPDALNEGWSCTAVPQDGAVVYRSIELFTYAADPTAYWQGQADQSADSHVYVAIAQTDVGWAAFVEDDSRHPIADPDISAAVGLGFVLHLDD